jgi:hypothetical protein
MKTKCLFLIWTLFCLNGCLVAQISGQVIDGETELPLSYVNIGVVGKDMGTISLEDGTFQLGFDGLAPGDTLRFSMIGYEDYDITGDGFFSEKMKLIALQPATYELQAVEIKSTTESFVIGNEDTRRPTWGIGGRIGKGQEWGVLIENPHGMCRLRDFNFYLKRSSFDRMALRLKIYQIENGQLKSILREDIRFMVSQRKGWVKVDLEEKGLWINEDVVATLEFLEGYSALNQSGLELSLGKKVQSLYARNSSLDEWEVFEKKGLHRLFILRFKVDLINLKRPLQILN